MLRQIFFLTSNSISLYHHSGHNLERIAAYACNAEGVEKCRHDLQQLPVLPTLLLCDLVEEDYRIDTIVHTFGSDRRALLARHMSRIYRGTDYRNAIVLGRMKTNKRKDEVLFSGLLNAELMDLWMNMLLQQKIPISGIYSLPLVSHKLLEKTYGTEKDSLLVTHCRESGLRQSFFQKGQLHFSRLTPVASDLPLAEYGRFVHAEIGKTKRYLSNLHLLGRDVTLDVCMPSSGALLNELEKLRDNETLTHYEMKDIGELAKRMGYKNIQQPSYCDELFIHIIATGREKNHYAHDQHRLYYNLHRIRNALVSGTALALLCGLFWAGMQVSDGIQLQQQTISLANNQLQAEERLANVQQRTPQADVSAEDIHLVVSTADRLYKQRRSPQALLTLAGQALLHQPGLELINLQWFVSTDRNATSSVSSSDEAGVEENPGEVIYDEEGYPIRQNMASENDQTENALFQIGILHGRIEPFDGNYARAHQHIQQLLSELNQHSAILLAEALELPLNTSSDVQLSGGIGEDISRAEASFTLRLVLGPANSTNEVALLP